MNAIYKRLTECLTFIRERTDIVPDVALVLGSGLGDYGKQISVKCSISYEEIPGFPFSTVDGHNGRFLFGSLGDKKIVVMQGRVHYYEGYHMSDVVLPIRLMGMIGARTLILTNAAGGISRSFSPGDLMLITDHLSFLVPSPLQGANIEELGTRFPDMSQVYSEKLADIVRSAAQNENIGLREGVYLQAPGPQYETPAEIEAFRSLGADAVGMSTACEAMAAVHMGMNVCGISCITNMAAGVSQKPLSHKEVKESASRVKEQFSRLITAIISSLPKEGE